MELGGVPWYTLPMKILLFLAVFSSTFTHASNENAAECGNLLVGFNGLEPFYQKALERLRNSNAFGLLIASEKGLELRVQARIEAAASWSSWFTGTGRETEAFPSIDRLEFVRSAIQGVKEAREIRTLAQARDARPLVDSYSFDGLMAEWIYVTALNRVESTYSLLSQTPSPAEILQVRSALASERAVRENVLRQFADRESSARDFPEFSQFILAGVSSQIADAKKYAAQKGILLPSDESLDFLIRQLATLSAEIPAQIGTLSNVLDRWAVLASEFDYQVGASSLSELTLCYLALTDGDVHETIARYRKLVEYLEPVENAEGQNEEERKLVSAIIAFVGPLGGVIRAKRELPVILN